MSEPVAVERVSSGELSSSLKYVDAHSTLFGLTRNDFTPIVWDAVEQSEIDADAVELTEIISLPGDDRNEEVLVQGGGELLNAGEESNTIREGDERGEFVSDSVEKDFEPRLFSYEVAYDATAEAPSFDEVEVRIRFDEDEMVEDVEEIPPEDE